MIDSLVLSFQLIHHTSKCLLNPVKCLVLVTPWPVSRYDTNQEMPLWLRSCCYRVSCKIHEKRPFLSSYAYCPVTLIHVSQWRLRFLFESYSILGSTISTKHMQTVGKKWEWNVNCTMYLYHFWNCVISTQNLPSHSDTVCWSFHTRLKNLAFEETWALRL